MKLENKKAINRITKAIDKTINKFMGKLTIQAVVVLLIFCIALTIVIVLYSNTVSDKARNSLLDGGKNMINITMPHNGNIKNIDKNLYVDWLEQKLGVTLEFNIIPDTNTHEFIELMLSSDSTSTDIIFSFSSDNDFVRLNRQLEKYAENGQILPLNDFIAKSTYYKRLLENFDEYNLCELVSAQDGNIYFVPGLDVTSSRKISQAFWINQEWLRKLNLKIPTTTDDFFEVMLAFCEGDANGNGIKDEIPIVFSDDSYSLQAVNYILNAFVYNDPENSRLVLENGNIIHAPSSAEWREGLKYLNKLYKADIIRTEIQGISPHQMSQIIMNPDNIAGSFACQNITDIILPNNPDVISQFIHVPPLMGENGIRNVAAKTPMPTANGVLTSGGKNTEMAFELLDFMLSEEAFQVGRYGEYKTDWSYANIGDIDLYGNPAVIRIKNNLRGIKQNKTLHEMGPFYTYTEIADSITWNGFQIDQEYLESRAFKNNALYAPKEGEYMKFIVFEPNEYDELSIIRNNIDEYVNDSIKNFMMGKLDVYDDSVWGKYLDNLQGLGLDKLIEASLKSYERSR